MSAVAEDFVTEVHLVGESSEPYRRQELADEIGVRQARLARLLESRASENIMAPADRLELETNIARARAAIEPLEAELAALVQAEDDRLASDRARLAAELEAARPALERRRDTARKRQTAALLDVEDAIDDLIDAIKRAIDEDAELTQISIELSAPVSPNIRPRIAARLGRRLRDDVRIRDVAGPFGNHSLQALAEAPAGRKPGARSRKAASEHGSRKGTRPAEPVASMPAWGDAFLGELRKGASVAEAAKAAGTSRAEVYRERNTNPGLAVAWDAAVARRASAGG